MVYCHSYSFQVAAVFAAADGGEAGENLSQVSEVFLYLYLTD